MRKQLLAATALIAIGGAAYAAGTDQTQTQAQTGQDMPPAGEIVLIGTPSMDSHLATQLIGETVYTSEATDAEAIGDITDLVIAESGEIEGVVIGVGGFLGVGEKSVAVDFDQLTWTPIQDGDQTDARLVLAITAEQLEAAPAFDVTVLQAEPEDRLFGTTDDTAAVAPDAQTAPATDGAGDQIDQQAATTMPDDQGGPAATEQPDTQTADITDQAEMPADEQQTATITEEQPDHAVQPDQSTEQAAVAADAQTGAESTDATADQQQTATLPQDLTDVDVATISAEQLINTAVYSGEDENVGSVGDVLLADDGMIDAVVLDIGGFLGIGTKPVAIAFDDLTVRTDADGNLYVYTPFTREQLEAATAYDAELYDDQRDSMRLTSST